MPTRPSSVSRSFTESRDARCCLASASTRSGTLGHAASRVDDVLKVLVRQRSSPVSGTIRRAGSQQHFRRALSECHQAIIRAMQGRHPLGFRAKRDLIDARQFLLKLWFVQPRFRRNNDKCSFRRIALDVPTVSCLIV